MKQTMVEEYIAELFAHIPPSKKANDLREELLCNMSERFADYQAQGKTDEESFLLVLESMGDISELLAEVIPVDEWVEQRKHYRQRNALLGAIAIGLYIMSPTFLIVLSSIGAFFGAEDFFSIIGLVLMFVCIAGATMLLYYRAHSTPEEYKNDDDKESDKESHQPYRAGGYDQTPPHMRNHTYQNYANPAQTQADTQWQADESYRNSTASDYARTTYAKSQTYTPPQTEKERKKQAKKDHEMYWLIVVASYIFLGSVADSWGYTWIIFIVAAKFEKQIWAWIQEKFLHR